MSQDESLQTTLEEFEKGDEITFNDRVQPLTVTGVYSWTSDVSVYVEGPRGGEYRLTAGKYRDPEVKRDVSPDYKDDSEWGSPDDLVDVEIVTPAAEVEPPVEVGDEFKKETTLDCVSYTGEFWGYRITAIDRENQQVTFEIVSVPESTDPDAWVDELSVHYQDFESRLNRWEKVDDLESDEDVQLASDGDTEDVNEADADSTIMTDGGVDVGDDAEEMSDEEYEITYDPMFDLVDRWEISMEEAEVFLENVGYFDTERYREVADYFGNGDDAAPTRTREPGAKKGTCPSPECWFETDEVSELTEHINQEHPGGYRDPEWPKLEH